jgi:hypothetical protein
MPARNIPPTTALRRAYFHDINSPVQVDVTSASAVAPKNTFMGSGFGAGDGAAGAGDFGTSDLGGSGFGPSAFAPAGGAVLLGGRYSVPFLCNCER